MLTDMPGPVMLHSDNLRIIAVFTDST